jgi:hypothetical protein
MDNSLTQPTLPIQPAKRFKDQIAIYITRLRLFHLCWITLITLHTYLPTYLPTEYLLSQSPYHCGVLFCMWLHLSRFQRDWQNRTRRNAALVSPQTPLATPIGRNIPPCLQDHQIRGILNSCYLDQATLTSVVGVQYGGTIAPDLVVEEK